MMFRRPQHVVAEAVHVLRDIAHGRKDLPQALVGVTPIVGRRAGYSDIVELDLADIEDVEVSDHRAFPPSRLTVEQTFVPDRAVDGSRATRSSRGVPTEIFCVLRILHPLRIAAPFEMP